MRRYGVHKKVRIPEEDLKLSSSELAKKYGISRITAWRVKYRGQREISIPKKKKEKVHFSKDEILRVLKAESEFLLFFDSEIVSEAKLRVIEYFEFEHKDIEEFLKVWYTEIKNVSKTFRKNKIIEKRRFIVLNSLDVLPTDKFLEKTNVFIRKEKIPNYNF